MQSPEFAEESAPIAQTDGTMRGRLIGVFSRSLLDRDYCNRSGTLPVTTMTFAVMPLLVARVS